MILKRLLDNKLKSQILEKGLSEEYTTTLLHTESPNEESHSIKWFLLLLSAGIGLFIAAAFTPLGVHSFAIIITSISLGFLAYSMYLKTSNK